MNERAGLEHVGIPRLTTQTEQLRAASLPPEASWISREMRPIAELCTGEEAHRQIQSHTLAHLNAALPRRTAF